jgi:hypothetical protein
MHTRCELPDLLCQMLLRSRCFPIIHFETPEETMKVMRLTVVLAIQGIMGATAMAGTLTLKYEPAGPDLRLIVDSQTGTNYQFQASTNLNDWSDLGNAIVGDGLTLTQIVSTAVHSKAFFRVRAWQAAGGPAPSDTEFTQAVVGKTLLGYQFVSATRFVWVSEWGNWDYTRINNTTGKLVFTYDEDSNDPEVYREECLLTFVTSTTGTFRYSEFNYGFEDSGSVATGPFDLGP